MEPCESYKTEAIKYLENEFLSLKKGTICDVLKRNKYNLIKTYIILKKLEEVQRKLGYQERKPRKQRRVSILNESLRLQIDEITIEETIAEYGGASIFTLDSNRETLTSNEESGTSTSHETLNLNEENGTSTPHETDEASTMANSVSPETTIEIIKVTSEDSLCGICFSLKKSVAIIHCGHVFCQQCIPKVGQQCFFCKKRVKAHHKIFL